MKKILYYAAVALCCFFIASCDSASKLAQNVAGSWTTAPEKMDDQAGMQGTMITTYSFATDPAQNPIVGGNVKITSLISTMMQIVGDDGLIEPISLSASSTASIEGKWKAVDDDEIVLDLNVPSLKVVVDPSAVVVSNNVLTGQSLPEVDSIRNQVSANLRAQLQAVLTLKYSSLRVLDDVKVKKSDILQFEIGKDKYVLGKN